MTLIEDQTAATLSAVARFSEAFARHDVDAVMAAMTADCVFESTGPSPDGQRYEGAAAVRAFWDEFFYTNPHANFVTEQQFAAGDRCVVLWRYDWGTPSPSSEPTPEVHHVRGVDIIRVRDGRVSEKLSYVKG